MRTSTSKPAAHTAQAPAPVSSADIKAKAHDLGFEVAGITRPDAVEAAGEHFQQFLRSTRHGEMAWLETKADRRADPRTLWPEVRSIVMLGQNYGPAVDPMAILGQPELGAISVYAQGRDYHDVVKKRLKALGRWLAGHFGVDVKVFVDTAPVLEKPLAAAAGVGWQGKHSNLVSREFGSWLFLGALFTTLEIEPDTAEDDHCGNCRACLDVCPTNAFPAPYQLDARRCISYLTIEHRSQIPREFRAAMGNRIFGCDDCLAVCPWNKYAKIARDSQLWPRDELSAPRLAELARLDDAAFRRLFSKSPVKRLGRDRFVRNVLIAIGNNGNADLADTVIPLLQDKSPLVRGMAVWALAQFLDETAFADLKGEFLDPDDHEVALEWESGR